MLKKTSGGKMKKSKWDGEITASKRKKHSGCIFGIILLLAIAFGCCYWGYSAYVYRDTAENRAFEYKVLNEEKSQGALYYKATVEIQQKGNLLPNLSDLYSVVKQIAGIRNSYYVYFTLPGYSKGNYFADTTSAGLGVFSISCNGNIDSKDKDLLIHSYGKKYYSERYPDESTIRIEAERAATKSAKTEIELLKFYLCQHLEKLLNFRNNDDFKKNGFGQGGNYYSWLTTCQDLQKRGNRLPNSYYDVGAAAGELLQLGMDYANSQGQETKYTSAVLPELMKKIDYAEYLDKKR